MNKILEIIPMLRVVPVMNLNPNILIAKESKVIKTIGKPRAIQGEAQNLLPRRVIKNFNKPQTEDVFTETAEPIQATVAKQKAPRKGHGRTDKRALDSYFDNDTPKNRQKAWLNSVVAELEQKDAQKEAIKEAERQRNYKGYTEMVEQLNQRQKQYELNDLEYWNDLYPNHPPISTRK